MPKKKLVPLLREVCHTLVVRLELACRTTLRRLLGDPVAPVSCVPAMQVSCRPVFTKYCCIPHERIVELTSWALCHSHSTYWRLRLCWPAPTTLPCASARPRARGPVMHPNWGLQCVRRHFLWSLAHDSPLCQSECVRLCMCRCLCLTGCACPVMRNGLAPYPVNCRGLPPCAHGGATNASRDFLLCITILAECFVPPPTFMSFSTDTGPQLVSLYRSLVLRGVAAVCS